MSMCVLGMSKEFKNDGIAVNALWPRTAIDTAAISNIVGKFVLAIISTNKRPLFNSILEKRC